MKQKLHSHSLLKESNEWTNRKTIQFATLQLESKRNISRVILENCDDSNFDIAIFAFSIWLLISVSYLIFLLLLSFLWARKRERTETKTYRKKLRIFKLVSIVVVIIIFLLAFQEFQQCLHFLVFTLVSIVCSCTRFPRYFLLENTFLKLFLAWKTALTCMYKFWSLPDSCNLKIHFYISSAAAYCFSITIF